MLGSLEAYPRRQAHWEGSKHSFFYHGREANYKYCSPPDYTFPAPETTAGLEEGLDADQEFEIDEESSAVLQAGAVADKNHDEDADKVLTDEEFALRMQMDEIAEVEAQGQASMQNVVAVDELEAGLCSYLWVCPSNWFVLLEIEHNL